jgi:hypothetical protein
MRPSNPQINVVGLRGDFRSSNGSNVLVTVPRDNRLSYLCHKDHVLIFTALCEHATIAYL